MNVARAGQTVPVRYRIVGPSGAGIADPASLESLTSAPDGSCGSGESDVVETYVGDAGLKDLGDGDWQYSWKTPKSYAGACRVMVLKLRGEPPYIARFAFK